MSPDVTKNPPRLRDLPPLRPCWNPSGHDFTMHQRNGLNYCWYCVQVSPQSRARLVIAERAEAWDGLGGA